MLVALIGSSGYVGKAVLRASKNFPNYKIIEVNRKNFSIMREQNHYDVILNCAMPSKRYWAHNNPLLDFESTVELTAQLCYQWSYEKLVQVSSISARSQLNTIYGRNKAAAEAICSHDNNLIFRLGPMFGKDLSKGVLIDMLCDRQVFVSGVSRYCFSNVDWVGRSILSNIRKKGILEIGARNSISLAFVAKEISSLSVFEGDVDHQEIETPLFDAPDAANVISFLKRQRIRQGEI